MSAADLHPAALPAARLLAECELRRLRRSGPGGQHRNKVETAVAILHVPTGVKAEANERRSQAENLSAAVFRLRLSLALEVRCPGTARQAPSPLWQSRCPAGRVNLSASHDDFPILLAEALDVIAESDAEVKVAAATLRCSSSQLIRLLKKEPRAMARLSRWRRERGLSPLK